MPTCDPEKFVNRKKELDYIKDKINRLARGDPFAPHERVVHFVGPSKIGKSCLLERCYAIVDDLPMGAPILIKLDVIKNRPGEFIDNFLVAVDMAFSNYLNISVEKRSGKSLAKFGVDMVGKINKRAEDKITVLFLDEINTPWKEEIQELEEHFLVKLLHENKHVVLIMAGRSPAMLTELFTVFHAREYVYSFCF